MTKMNTKLALAAALLATGFATSAFASDASEVLHQDVNQAVVAQQTYGTEAYAYAPAAKSNFTVSEQRAFDRNTAAALSR
ncbi:MAG: hypothetical protein JSR61_01450 [Proteobacteria bacterium]|nr:hypothetical protein [Pseudomonadota bacterium]